MISIWKSKVLVYHLTEAKAKLIKIITVDVVSGFLGTLQSKYKLGVTVKKVWIFNLVKYM